MPKAGVVIRRVFSAKDALAITAIRKEKEVEARRLAMEAEQERQKIHRARCRRQYRRLLTQVMKLIETNIRELAKSGNDWECFRYGERSAQPFFWKDVFEGARKPWPDIHDTLWFMECILDDLVARGFECSITKTPPPPLTEGDGQLALIIRWG